VLQQELRERERALLAQREMIEMGRAAEAGRQEAEQVRRGSRVWNFRSRPRAAGVGRKDARV
jgi:hypothetical protein